MDGGIHIGRGVVREIIGHILRQHGRQPFQFAGNILNCFQCIRARGLVDAHLNGRPAVEGAVGGVCLRPKLHSGHIPDANQSALFVGSHNDLLKFSRLPEASLGLQCILDLLIRAGRAVPMEPAAACDTTGIFLG